MHASCFCASTGPFWYTEHGVRKKKTKKLKKRKKKAGGKLKGTSLWSFLSAGCVCVDVAEHRLNMANVRGEMKS